MHSKFKLGSSKVTVCLHYITAKEIKITTRTTVGQVKAVKAIPKILTPMRSSLGGMKVEQFNEESLLKHIHLSGI